MGMDGSMLVNFLETSTSYTWGFPGSIGDKESIFQFRSHKKLGFDPWVRKIPWRRAWQPTPVFLPGESHGQRSLAGSGPLDHKELVTTEAT